MSFDGAADTVVVPTQTGAAKSPVDWDRAPKPRQRGAAATLWRRRLWSLPAVAALAAAGGIAYHPIFGLSAIVPAVAVSAIVPVLVAALWNAAGRPANRPRPLLGSLVLTLAAWVLAVSASTYRSRAYAHVLPTPGLLRRIGADLLDAPRGVLTTVLPAPDHPELLVLVSATVWMAAFAGAETALRSGSTVLPALPGVLMLAVPVALSTDAPGHGVTAAAAAIGAAGLLLVCRAPGRRSPWRTLLVGVPWVALLAVAAGFAAPHAPGVGTPPDLRDNVAAPPPVRLSGVNPLDRISAWLLTPDQPLFTVAGPADPDRYWRLTVLDRYDGTTWYPVGGLRPTGGRVPDDGQSPVTKRTKQRVTLDQLDGVWLPAADRPASVTAQGLKLAVDPTSGAVATGSGLHPGLTYQVESQVPTYDPDRLQYLATASDPAYAQLPDLDAASEPIPMVEEFRKIAEKATQGSQFPYQQALKLADWLRANNRYDITAVPGHSYRNLRFFLESSKEGTSEQFASAFAVLGRSLGLPTRVVVGFSRGTQLPDGSWRVDSGNVIAWPEVEFEQVGWVPFYPTPGEAGRSGSPKNDQTTVVPPTAAPPSAPPPPSRADKDRDIAQEQRPEGVVSPIADAPEDGSTPLWWWAAPIAALAALAVSHVGVAAAAPGTLRRRRRRGPPGARVFGAWRQIGDRFGDLGMPHAEARTVREVADFGAERLPAELAERVSGLGTLVNEASYADRDVTGKEADDAWRVCTDVEHAVRRADGREKRRTRMVRALSPRTVVATLRRR
ncbi:hypothetical protein GCM10023205_38920 [Yinghuangia aomiensis]|uniref:Transglutaminase-like domain-containing protein n=1 Tax=Yinghuangia aomiensis TaxID=676205 RepID=A0ABP9HFJ9_9ACTN